MSTALMLEGENLAIARWAAWGWAHEVLEAASEVAMDPGLLGEIHSAARQLKSLGALVPCDQIPENSALINAREADQLRGLIASDLEGVAGDVNEWVKDATRPMGERQKRHQQLSDLLAVLDGFLATTRVAALR